MADIRGKLVGLCEAFNAHDLDRIMMFFAEDCVLEMPRGPHAWGARFEGKQAVRQGLASRFEGLPDVPLRDRRALRGCGSADRHIEMDIDRHYSGRETFGGQGMRLLHVPGRPGDAKGLLLENR